MEEIELFATENKIPIMQKESMLYLMEYIKVNNVKKILEIGTAIGYSAIMMASTSKKVNITTIEKDKERYRLAISNIKSHNVNDQIEVINKDACEVELNDTFDLIFIDAAKGKNKLFFNKFKDNLQPNGVIITDNLSFHGLVENPLLIKTKNQKNIVNKIKDFILFLDNNQEYLTEYIKVGDTIAISKRRDDNETNCSS